jgi:hypothetical protein
LLEAFEAVATFAAAFLDQVSGRNNEKEAERYRRGASLSARPVTSIVARNIIPGENTKHQVT